MKKLFFIISVVIIPFLAKGQDTLIYPSPDMLYSSWSCPDSIYGISWHSSLPHHFAIENYGENTHTIYGIAVTAKFPIPANSTLRFYERIDGAVRITDTIAGETVPYPFNYYIKYYPYCSATTTASKTIPCFLYLFDTPHKNIDTFYVGLNAPLSVWVDSNQIHIYDILYWTPDNRGQTFIFVNEDIHNPAENLYDRYTAAGGAGGSLYPLIGLPCTAPQAPSVSAEGDSLRMEWDNVGEFYQLSFRNTDTDSTVLVSDTLADNHHTLSDRLFEAGNYEVRLRKACLYTTATYNTLVWSEWSNPTAFAVSAHAGITPLTPSQSLSFSLLPNPARGSVTIVMDEPSGSGNGERQLTLLDLQGREIATISHLSGNTFSLDLGTLAPGTYLIRLTTPDATAHQRLVVQ